MRLEFIPAVHKVSSENEIGTLKPVMSEGETLMCQAIGRQGDAILFRNKGDSFFMARVMGQVDIGIGDNVQMFVSRADGAQYELSVLDIVPGSAAQADGQQGEMLQDMGTALMHQSSDKVLAAAMSMLKQTPGLSPKAAVFLAANNLAASPENVQVLSNLVKGEAKAGTVLAEIFGSVEAQPGGEIGSTAAKSANQGQTQQTVQQGTQAQTERTIAPQTAGIDAGQTARTVAPQTADTVAAAPLPNEAAADIKEQILQTVASMFSALSEKAKGQNIKKTVEKTPENLKELKLLLENNDKNNEKSIGKAGYLEQQFKVMSQVKRIACFQIPFVVDNQIQNTAELFVYKHKNKDKNGVQDKEEFVILIGLDTQYAGRVETLVKIQDKNVELRFGLDMDDTQRMVQNSGQRLADAIESTGFNLGEMNTYMLEQRTTVLNAQEVLLTDDDAANANIDVKI